MDSDVFSKQAEMKQVEVSRPHVVILGAGASLAVLPNGDCTGRKLPLMDNLVAELGLETLVARSGMDFGSNNFEAIYSKLFEDDIQIALREQIESLVYGYFSALQLPNHPTIYDHLLLSLREKDVVATFNWDPLLIQAYRRNGLKGGFKLPRLLFLHGNVAVGHCEQDHVVGTVGTACSRCGQPFSPTRLLYPIAQKDYQSGKYIASQMGELQIHLKSAFMVTIFGYGAPESDIEAVRLLKSAWGNVNDREMEQIEIIDVKDEDELDRTWRPFIHTHHRDIHTRSSNPPADFYNSWIANHPRRTGEAWMNQYCLNRCVEHNPVPQELSFEKLWGWFRQLTEFEENGATDQT